MALKYAFFFKESIGERPIRHLVHQPAGTPADVLCEPSPDIWRIQHAIKSSIVFAPDDWQIWLSRSLYFMVDLSNRSRDHLRLRDLFLFPKDIERRVVWIDMRRDEINWHVVFVTMSDETIYPSGLCGSRSAYSQQRADRFESACRQVVQVVVGFFLGLACPGICIRLLPNFEVPIGDLGESISVNQGFGEQEDQ